MCSFDLQHSVGNRICSHRIDTGADIIIIVWQVFEKLELSARAYDKILRIARTVADLDGSETVNSDHISQAVQYRSLDRTLWRNVK